MKASAVLQFQGDWSREFPGEGKPIDSTDEFHLIRELVVATEAGLDAHSCRSVRLQCFFRNLQL